MKDAQVGFNTNLSYRGRVLHIQTEDSGRERPHIITHLYHQGAILATKRTSYAELVEREDLADQVRALMKAQHRTMMIELRDGVHETVIERVAGPLAAPAAPPASVARTPGPAPKDAVPAKTAAPPADDTDLDQSEAFLAALRELAGEKDAAAGRSAAPGASPLESNAFLAALRELAGDGSREPHAGPQAEPPQPRPSSVPPTPSRTPTGSMPPPTPVQHRPSYRPPTHPDHPEEVIIRRPVGVTDGAPAPAPARALDASTPIREREGFGRDLISDRSLDDVILSYLAEELTRKDDE